MLGPPTSPWRPPACAARPTFRRLLALSALGCATATALVGAACGARDVAESSAPDASFQREGGPVDPLEPPSGTPSDGGTASAHPSCERYCSLVQDSCAGEHAQYADDAECLRVCALLEAGDAGEESANTLACRQLYAGNPAKTDPTTYCPIAGPFGGARCGARCEVFCQLALATCAPEAGAAPFASVPDCATACQTFPFRDAGADGAVEQPDAAPSGDTLNCRLQELRAATLAPNAHCANLGLDSGACR